MKKFLLIFFVISPLVSLTMLSGVVYYLYQKPYDGPETTFKIRSGEGFSSINARLYDRGLVSNPRIFHYLTRQKDLMTKFKKGTFVVPSQTRMDELLNIFVNGQPILVQFTIPEGKNIYDIAQILEEKQVGDPKKFIELTKDRNFIKKQGYDFLSLEGYLYPETYKIDPDASTEEIIQAMVKLFKSKTKGILNHPFLSPHEIIILASIVEKETGAKFERPTIAAVFLNRLKKRMRLQSDPTTIYGMIETYKGNITKEHLRTPTPFNTYTIPALPIGPIANPSLEAIQAVLNPSNEAYLYFVSKNDGTHIFSETYEEHKKGVEFFQVNRKQREGKSWRQLKKN